MYFIPLYFNTTMTFKYIPLGSTSCLMLGYIVFKKSTVFVLADLIICYTLQLLCTIVAFLASIPLGELFFFHLILMRKVRPTCHLLH